MTGLMKEQGKSEKDAAQIVEKHLRKKGINVPATRRGIEPAWKRLQSWRDKCIAGKKGDLATRYYRDALYYQHPSFPPQELMDFLLDPPVTAILISPASQRSFPASLQTREHRESSLQS